jgi:methyl-accepting chemotaxis protein
MLKNVTIGKRLGLAFGALGLLLMCVAATGFWGTRSAGQLATGVIKVDSPLVEHAQRARANTLGLRRFEKDVFLNIASPDKVVGYVEKWQDQMTRLEARLKTLEGARVRRAGPRGDQADAQGRGGLSRGASPRCSRRSASTSCALAVEANVAIEPYKDEIRRLEDTAQEYAEKHSDRMAARAEVVARQLQQSLTLTLVALVLAIVVAVVLAIQITRSITVPLQQAVQVADAGRAGRHRRAHRGHLARRVRAAAGLARPHARVHARDRAGRGADRRRRPDSEREAALGEGRAGHRARATCSRSSAA